MAQLPLCWPNPEGKCGCGLRHTTGGKAPLNSGGYKSATTDTEKLEALQAKYPQANWGASVQASGLLVVDIDSDDALAEAKSLGLPPTVIVKTGGGGYHYYYRKPITVPAINAIHKGNSKKLDILGTGYTVLPPSRHSSGDMYRWDVGPEEWKGEIPEAPEWACALLLDSWLKKTPSEIVIKLLLGKEYSQNAEGKIDRSETLFRIACELVRMGLNDETAVGVLEDRDQTLGASTWELGPKYAGRRDSSVRYSETLERAKGAVKLEPKLLLRSKMPRGESVSPQKHVGQEVSGKLRLLEKTDHGNAQAIALLYSGKICYNQTDQRWYKWRGHSWTVASEGDIHTAALEAASARLALSVRDRDDKGTTWSLRSQDAYRVESAVKLSKVTLGVSETFDDIDHIFGVANGIIDLRTSEFRPGLPGDYVSRSSSIVYDPDAQCPRFSRFMGEVFDHDHELIEYVWRAIGYSLTGFTKEECLFLLHGTGRNGKGTLDWVLRELLGEYYYSAPFQTFEETREGGPSNDIAQLAGRRLVSASEATEGRRLNESRIKRATGRDPITARFLHKEFFTYIPKFKIWLQANHLPIIRGTDEGIWRRIRLVPFRVNFEDKEDQNLRDTLMDEMPGILVQAIHYAQVWYNEGGLSLRQAPAAVSVASKGYRIEMDTLQSFIDDCLDMAAHLEVESAPLYRAYRAWAMDHGEYVLGHTAFGRKFAEKGFPRARTSTTRSFGGAALNDRGERYASKVL